MYFELALGSAGFPISHWDDFSNQDYTYLVISHGFVVVVAVMELYCYKCW